MTGSSPYTDAPAVLRSRSLAAVFVGAYCVFSLVCLLAVRANTGIAEFSIPATGLMRWSLVGVTLSLGLVILPPLRAAILLVAGMAAIVLFAGRFGGLILDGAVIAGLAAVAAAGLSRLEFPPPGQVVMAGVAALVLSAFTALGLYGRLYANPLAVEMALAGLLHHDTLFHAALVQSLNAIGETSVALDGYVPLAYHDFSHRVIGALAGWGGLSPLQAYGHVLPLVGHPLLFASVIAMWRAVCPAGFSVWNWLTPLAIAAILANVDWGSYLVSESYLFSLVFLCMAVALVAPPRSSVALGLVAVLVALASLSKISVGAVLACFVVAAVFLRAPSLRSAAAALLAGAMPFLAVFFSNRIDEGASEPILGLFAFFDAAPEQAVFHLIWAIGVTVYAMRAWPGDRETRALSLSLLVGVWAGICSASIVNLPAGAAYYFMNVSFWLGLAAIGACFHAARYRPARFAGTGSRNGGRLTWAVLVLGCVGQVVSEGWPASFRDISAEIAALDESRLSGDAAYPVVRVFDAIAAHDGFDAVFISPGLDGYWSSFRTPCLGPSLAAAAFTEHPLMMGLAPEPCVLTPYYGLASYRAETSRARDLGRPDEICAEAGIRGFQRVLVIDRDGARVVACGGAGSD